MGELESVMRSLSEEISETVLIGITGKDGLSVATFSKEQLAAAEYSAEVSSIFSIIDRSVESLSLGNAKEFFVLTDSFGIFGVPIIYDCYFFVVGRLPINLGKIRLEMKKYIPKIEEMMK